MGYRGSFRVRRFVWGWAVVGMWAAITAGPVDHAQASCNIIPGTARSFRGVLGSVDRPFAEPGTWVELSLASPCHSASPGFSSQAGDHVVTVVFKPPAAASNVVVLAPDCTAIQGDLAACRSVAQVADATCLEASTVAPGLDLELVLREGVRNLRFRFPDTDSFFDGTNDDRTLSGPAAIAVTAVGQPLPCGLATTDCGAQGGLIACVDEIYAADGTCSSLPHDQFAYFTALPPANDYQALCSRPSPPCVGNATEIRVTTDRDGNLLVPMLWDGILVSQDQPIARMLRGSAAIEPFAGSGGAISVPGDSFLESFSPEGGLLPPVFDPQNDPQASGVVTLFGSADASHTVLRVARRSASFTECGGGDDNGQPCEVSGDCPAGTCGPTTCANGPNAGLPCAADSDCNGGECGPALFELRDRFEAGTGPIVIRRYADPALLQVGVCEGLQGAGASCVADVECSAGERCVLYSLEAQDPVPLDGILPTNDLLALIVLEATAGEDLDGDGDMIDSVVLLRDRVTGVGQALGAPVGCGIDGAAQGRAVVRIAQPPFSFPAAAVEADILAFLESEAAEGGCDTSGDGDAGDALLRVFRLGPSEVTGTLALPQVADPAALIDGQSLAISLGQVFFRREDAVLTVLDASSGSDTPLCPTVEASVAGGSVAFLRPESTLPTSGCAGGSLNGDADTNDRVVYRWTGGSTAESLGRAATAVSLSGVWIGALISESDDGGVDLNGDGDVADAVVELHGIVAPAGTWVGVGQAADTLDVVGSTVAFTTPEGDQGGVDLNGDGDGVDRVLQVYRADSGALVNVGFAAEEFVMGPDLIAFRTRESDQSVDLNADGDTADDVLQVYDVTTGTVLNTGQTVVPCDQEACDPRTPYLVLGDTVRFLTLESVQGEDLNRDGDTSDLILQIFNASLASSGSTLTAMVSRPDDPRFPRTVAVAALPRARTVTTGGLVRAGFVTAIGSVEPTAGRTPLLGGQDGHIAYAETGSCVEVLERACSGDSGCPGAQECSDEGLCERRLGPCRTANDCPSGAECRNDIVISTAADSDGDELPDLFDNCPHVANVRQQDANGNGIGDACEAVCGDGIVQRGQECDGESYCRADCSMRTCGEVGDIRGPVSAASALFILRAAAGSVTCDDCVCNIDGRGTTTATDALTALRYAVGLPALLRCPVCPDPRVSVAP